MRHCTEAPRHVKKFNLPGCIARHRACAQRTGAHGDVASNGLANGQGVPVDAARRQLWVGSPAFGFATAPLTPSALKNADPLLPGVLVIIEFPGAPGGRVARRENIILYTK